MRDFFAVRDARDSLYRFLATDSDRARLVQELWERVEPFVDNRRPEAAAADFPSTFWEMYAAAALLEAQVELVPKRARRSLNGGPDIEASPTTWVEAILATPGTTEQRVVTPSLNPLESRAVWVPDDKLLVRIQTAINTKRDKYVEYRNRGIVRETEPYVIAVNGRSIPFVTADTDVPRVVRVAFGIGELTVTIDTRTNTVVREEHPPLGSVMSGKNEVLLALFSREEYAFVSAIFWGTADVLNQPLVIGRDVIVVHNPLAKSPLPLGWFRQGREYWVENGEVRERHWWREASAG